MKLTVLGCLGAYPYKNQGTTGYLLQSDEFNLLIDAGSATLIKLQATSSQERSGDIAFNLWTHKRFHSL